MIDSFSRISQKMEMINMKMPLGQGGYLFNLAKKLPDNSLILEIGAYEGFSTCCLAYSCLGTNKKVTTIDLFQNPEDLFKRFWKNVTENGLENYIDYIQDNSINIAKIWNKQIDLLFIDGGHDYPIVLSDFDNFYPWVKSGGMIVMHDVGNGRTWPGPYKVWHEYARHKLKDCTIFGNLAMGYKK